MIGPKILKSFLTVYSMGFVNKAQLHPPTPWSLVRNTCREAVFVTEYQANGSQRSELPTVQFYGQTANPYRYIGIPYFSVIGAHCAPIPAVQSGSMENSMGLGTKLVRKINNY